MMKRLTKKCVLPSAQDSFYSTIGQANVSLIDLRDIAAAAVTALTGKTTAGKVFELNGPEAVAYDELAARISSVAGRTIRHVSLSPAQMRRGMTAAGVPEWRIDALLELDEYYAAGKGNASDAALRGLMDRHPRRLDAYLAELGPAAFAK